MKTLAKLLLLSFICCSQPNRSEIDKEIRHVLDSLSDSVRINGMTGWIPFLEKSKEFKWVFMESTETYDSLVTMFQRKRTDTNPTTISWDSVHIEHLSEREVKLVAVLTIGATVDKDKQASAPLNFKSTLQKIDRLWKFHYCELSMYEPPHTENISAADTSTQISQSIDGLIKKQYGPLYQVSAVLDVDDRTANAAYRIYQDMGYIFEDPNHKLQHCFLVSIAKYEDDGQALCDSGSIAIVREKKIVWCSKPILHHFAFTPLPGFGDLNGDGITDILFSAQMDMRGYGEALWILSPDSSGGRLLNEVDEDKQSTIVGPQGTFRISQPKGSITKVIEVDDLNSESSSKSIYTWNGRSFIRQSENNSKTE